MESNTELVKRALRNGEKGDMTAMGAEMADDFMFTGATPQPLNKAQFIALMRTLTSAIPDWKFNITDISETGDTVRMKNRITGKNTGTFNYPAMGLYSVQATGRSVALPAETIDVVVRNGKLSAIKVSPAQGGGLMGILNQLGIKAPAAPAALNEELMRSKKELVKLSFNTVEAGDMQAMSPYLADDFTLSGATPEPLKKQQFIDLMQALTTALPDWKFNISDIREAGEDVRVVIHVTGKNTGIVNLPSLGIYAVRATGRNVALPAETVEAVVSEGKISALRVTPVPGGGVLGILAQLGIKVPAHAGSR